MFHVLHIQMKLQRICACMLHLNTCSVRTLFDSTININESTVALPLRCDGSTVNRAQFNVDLRSLEHESWKKAGLPGAR